MTAPNTKDGPPMWLVLPTYNEPSNPRAIVAAGRERLDPPRHLLVVDDSSPDGTGQIADRLAAEHSDMSVLHRARKEGLGPAYVAGFREALAGGARLVGQMDADFSHDPADLPRLLAASEDADLVLGSRYARRRGRGMGSTPPDDQSRRVRLRPGGARCRGARPHRRLQGLSPRGARGDRPGLHLRVRL